MHNHIILWCIQLILMYRTVGKALGYILFQPQTRIAHPYFKPSTTCEQSFKLVFNQMFYIPYMPPRPKFCIKPELQEQTYRNQTAVHNMIHIIIFWWQLTVSLTPHKRHALLTFVTQTTHLKQLLLFLKEGVFLATHVDKESLFAVFSITATYHVQKSKLFRAKPQTRGSCSARPPVWGGKMKQ